MVCFAQRLLTWQFSSDNHPDNEILVHRAALETLGAITGDISVVTMAGPHRTGKSMLMNRLAPHGIGKSPFHVRLMIHRIVSIYNKNGRHSAQNLCMQVNKNIKDSSNSVIMAVVPPCASGSKNTVVLIDTPGLFAPQRPALFDAEVRRLMMLYSLHISYGVLFSHA